MRNLWTEEQLATLRQLYPETHNDEIAKLVAHSAASVQGMACQLGLKKSRQYIFDSKSRGNQKRDLSTYRSVHGHGTSADPTYSSWSCMRQRCENPNQVGFKNYGGRGIQVCDAWKVSFAQFLKDMGPRPAGHTLDRIDPNGPYEPGNCRWATNVEQHNNRRNNRLVTAFGRTQNLTQWAREVGMTTSVLDGRLNKMGWPVERALTEKVHPNSRRRNGADQNHKT